MAKRAVQASETKPGAENRPEIAYLPIESIEPDPLNPRHHSREQIRAIARSIQTFGFNAPILVDKHYRIVVGHGRFEASLYLKQTHLPVVRLEHLSEQQAKAYMLADNKLSDRSSWDDQQLALRLRELQDIAIDFEIEATGFEAPEIDFRIQSLEPGDPSDADDEFEPPEGPAVARPGDVWTLGPHRLSCGNALEINGPVSPTLNFLRFGPSFRAKSGDAHASSLVQTPPLSV